MLIVGGALLSWSVLLVLSRVILTEYGLDPWAFTFIQMMAGGMFLIAVAGQTKGTGALLRDPVIWAYGLLRVMTAACFTAALLHVSASNASFLSVLSVPTSALAVWYFATRPPVKREWLGHALILIGVGFLITQLDDGWRNPAVMLMLMSELCVVASTLIAEFHPVNKSADRRQRAGLTGAMLVVSAVVMLFAFVAVQSVANADATVPMALFADPTLWVSAAIVGILLRGPSMYLALAAIDRVKSENYLAGMAALPLTTMMLEAGAGFLGLLPPVSVMGWATGFGLVMILGSVLVISIRARSVATTLRTAQGR